jgi:hypothetical protein
VHHRAALDRGAVALEHVPQHAQRREQLEAHALRLAQRLEQVALERVELVARVGRRRRGAARAVAACRAATLRRSARSALTKYVVGAGPPRRAVISRSRYSRTRSSCSSELRRSTPFTTKMTFLPHSRMWPRKSSSLAVSGCSRLVTKSTRSARGTKPRVISSSMRSIEFVPGVSTISRSRSTSSGYR